MIYGILMMGCVPNLMFPLKGRIVIDIGTNCKILNFDEKNVLSHVGNMDALGGAKYSQILN